MQLKLYHCLIYVFKKITVNKFTVDIPVNIVQEKNNHRNTQILTQTGTTALAPLQDQTPGMGAVESACSSL